MAYLPDEIQQWLNTRIGTIDSFQTVGGGCINYTGSINTKNHSYFIKWNKAKEFPQIFNKEAQGLNLLNQGILRIPQVIDHYDGDEFSCLLLENIQPAPKSIDYWQILGEGLAHQHKITSKKYGLSHNNYAGSLLQDNSESEDWIEFFISNRLKPQVKLAREKGLMDEQVSKKFEQLYKQLDSLLEIGPPALLHGDLWSGNVMVDEKGRPVLIDPAVYYGNREVDLAMTKLFGGFDTSFYEAYLSTYPTSGGLDARIDIYNLYPLLIHLNLFGRGYINQILFTLERFN
ncbi:fructosamine kinase family protein [Fulvivirga lutimaris]|uniref:fructosamine kinase family protein n=1 Tax=Fulvivirga lutimaris TaxID=1819566 RepID=UPI0012BD0C64|nr:fructosamine kinase family protein [Fulvivirga lutimaris]MTI39030.1 ketosamine-3-kinase [Fulvivirga lutimaris]